VRTKIDHDIYARQHGAIELIPCVELARNGHATGWSSRQNGVAHAAFVAV